MKDLGQRLNAASKCHRFQFDHDEMFVPLLNLIIFLLLVVLPGQKTANKYGEPSLPFERVDLGAVNFTDLR